MDLRDRRGLKEAADRALARAAYEPRKLMLVYTGATAVLMLLVTALNFILQSQIAGTGGLGGLGLRSMLETAAQVLQLGTNLIVPFWTMGYAACVLRIIRGQRFDLTTMLDGFRSFGPVLRLTLLRSLYFLMIAMVCLYPSMMIFLWTPLAEPFLEIMEPYMEVTGDGTSILLEDAVLTAASETLMPAVVIYVVLFLILAAPKFYSFRMADFALMDDPKAGAMMALRRSTAMMKGSRISLLKLDASFWWFYLLDALLMALLYGDVLLTMMGVTLPFGADTAYFVFYVLYLAAQLGLYVWVRNKVECTYAAGYEILRQELDRKLEQLTRKMQNQNEA